MSTESYYPLLESIDSPAQLRALPRSQLPALAQQLRDFLIRSVAGTGGHLAANLGTVELTIALHYVFRTPEDRLVWDVGHQSYAHKILTGRRRDMARLRQQGGISGFPRREESPFDSFGAGHSSTSVSAALGMAIAARLDAAQRHTVAVIGDGAMSAGMAFEALNHAGDEDADLLVVLNDNEMSISRNVGGMSRYLAKILSGRLYTSVREGGKKVLSGVPAMKELARRAEEHMKGMVVPGTLFEELGFHYLGPIDGHDVLGLVKTLSTVRDLRGPRFLHVVTRKGKGYAPAEADPCEYHGVSRFDPEQAVLPKPAPERARTYTQAFGRWICAQAERDPKLVAITPAMREGSGLVEFAERFPQRFFDVGIAEQHALTLAAGLACEGYRPVVAIYSTFLQRAYDQLIHDIALQKLPVLLAIDRAGLVGPDGATHAGSFDLSYLRCIPGVRVLAPATLEECAQMLDAGIGLDGPVAVRYPRGGESTPLPASKKADDVLRGHWLHHGRGVALLAWGSMVAPALAAGRRLDASVCNMRSVAPLDEELLRQCVAHHDVLVTVEENAVAGGAGSAVAEWLANEGMQIPIRHLGLPASFIEHGSREQLLSQCGLDTEGIEAQARAAAGKYCNDHRRSVIS